MPTIEWNRPSEKIFEAGVDRGVLYPKSGPGVAWNGLVNVTKNVSGAEVRSTYIDGIKYLQYSTLTEYNATLQAYWYPEEFERCDGLYQDEQGVGFDDQPRESFGLAYRTLIGNDVDGLDHAYKLHLIYNALATPSPQSFASISAQPAATVFSWGLSTVPVGVAGYAPTAHIVLDASKIGWGGIRYVEGILYGSSEEPRLITPLELQETVFPEMASYPGLNMFPSTDVFPEQ